MLLIIKKISEYNGWFVRCKNVFFIEFVTSTREENNVKITN